MLSLLTPLIIQAAVSPTSRPSASVPILVSRTAASQTGGGDGEYAPVTLEVDVAAEGRTLWSGPLRVARGSSSSYRQDLSEPPAARCDGERYPGRTRSTGLNVNLSLEGYGEMAEALSLTVRWSRVAEAPCPLPAGVRTVELTQMVRLAPGGTVTLGGDGGLTIRLRRLAR